VADQFDLESRVFEYLDRTRWTVEGNDGGWVRTMGRRDDHWWQGVAASAEVPQVQIVGPTAFVRGWCTGAAFGSRVSVSRLEKALGCSVEQGGWVRTTTSQLEGDDPAVLPLASVEALLRDDRLDYQSATLIGGSAGPWLEWDMPRTSPWRVHSDTGELQIDYLFGGKFRMHFEDTTPPALPPEWLESDVLRAQFGLELEDAARGGEDHAIRLSFAPGDLGELIMSLAERVEVDGPVDAGDVLEVFLHGDDLDDAWSLVKPVLLASAVRPLGIARIYPSGERQMLDTDF
jgi:hypothetical protein